MKPIELCIVGGNAASNLLSMDVDCLAAVTYTKFVRPPTSAALLHSAPVLSINVCNNPYFAPTGALPALVVPPPVEPDATPSFHAEDVQVVSGLEPVLDNLRGLYGARDPDTILFSPNSATNAHLISAKARAFASLVQDALHDAVEYEQWCHPVNYTTHTRRWFADHSPFPLNYLVPRQRRQTVLDRLVLKYPEPDGDTATSSLRSLIGALTGSSSAASSGQSASSSSRFSLLQSRPAQSTVAASDVASHTHSLHFDEERLYRNAREALLAISQQLGRDGRFLLGDHPCYVDALVFAHLHMIFNSKLPSSRLAETARSYNPLVRYCERMYASLFASDISTYGAVTTSEAQSAIDEKRLLRTRAWQFGLASIVSTIAYLFLSGQVVISAADDDDDDDGNAHAGVALDDDDDEAVDVEM